MDPNPPEIHPEPACPRIVIVGRPNVGKSSLLNLLARRRVSIVDPTSGVTRDRVSTFVNLPAVKSGQGDCPVELIDTGGYGVEDTQQLTAEIEQQIARGLADADLTLFVIDAQAGVVTLDQEVARMLRTTNGRAPVIVVANKVDGPSHEAAAQEAARLGFGAPLTISATSGHNKNTLLQAIRSRVDSLPATPDNPSPRRATGDSELLLAIAGKRNAGKSTLVNALAGQDRVIVSEIEGTTRDSVDVSFKMDGHAFTAIDTAGVRKTKSLSGDIEFYSHHRTLRSVRRADVVLLLIDAAVPVSQVDKQLAAEVLRHHKPCVIVLNKWDIAKGQYTQDEYLEYLEKSLRGLDFAPVAFISAIDGAGLRDLVAMAVNLHKQAGHRVGTGELNRLTERILDQQTPRSKIGRHPKVYYVTQLDIHPPTIGLFVNDADMFDPTYERFMLNRYRDDLPYSEVPIRLVFRGKQSIPAHARLALKHEASQRRPAGGHAPVPLDAPPV